ncbi:MAG: hypothetical protein ACT4QE_24235 [Anaerolineales bacterium]
MLLTALEPFLPTLLVFIFLIRLLTLSLVRNNGDVGEMARLGMRHMAGEPGAREGYDGQYVYVLALNPNPAWAAQQPPGILDTPAYRYQRILLSLVARVLSLAQPLAVPWVLLAINVIAQMAGTFLVGELLAAYGVSRWYALAYGLWVGFAYTVRLAMTEPLAYAFIAGALLASRCGQEGRAAVLYGLALFTKEVTLLFVVAHLVWLVLERRWTNAIRLSLLSFLPFCIFQFFIFHYFGRFGLGSGGFHGSGFEFIPYMGLWRIGQFGWQPLLLFALLYLPIAVLPSVWGVVESARRLANREWTLPVLALLPNAAIFAFTPFSTYSEPLGLVRLVCGLVLAVLLFGAQVRSRRVLNYSLLWIVMLVMLLNET